MTIDNYEILIHMSMTYNNKYDYPQKPFSQNEVHEERPSATTPAAIYLTG